MRKPKLERRRWRLAAILCVILTGAVAQAQAPAENVIFVMTDGLRWQEIFRGADAALINKENGGIEKPDEVKRLFWRDTPEARREALMPFLWRVVAKEGQLWGNRDKRSEVYVTNGFNFSYPGYGETLSGFPDPRIDSNDKKPNPNTTVLEWLSRRPRFQGKVAAFGAWDVISVIASGERGGFLVNAGFDPLMAAPVSPTLALLNRWKQETKIWDDEPLDAFTFHTALEYTRLHKPRVLYISLGETDNWAHDGKYDLYLQAAHRADAFLKELWDTVRAMPTYRGKTALIFSPDHGRGEAPVEWKSHGQKIPDSKYIWMAFLGSGVAAAGEKDGGAPVTQSQIAATLAALLGEDYAGAIAKAGKPIQGVLSRK